MQLSEVSRLEQASTSVPGSLDEESGLTQSQALVSSSEKWNNEKSPSATPSVASLADSVTTGRGGEELPSAEYWNGKQVMKSIVQESRV